ncbi:protein-tyrosine phosphatase 2 [Akanthomyces lecanii RCEF 1005]|uniref:Protein-tyrosine phosphatase 2 n=1 Tax=Akanthomyces lecanii RCEF 1005 TaxID=1081108 RepID=A0A162KG99_CORDF|nr:protein-tyrosine phosphatase 2 [Akanthomyces lecanii RCEF 1005]
MDKIPIHKLRRKPKPPAIETSIDRNPTNTTVHLAAEDAAAPRLSKSPSFPRMSPFRRLRGVVSNGTNSTNEQGEESRLKLIPAFLTQSDEELIQRFQEIQQIEGDRRPPTTRPIDETARWYLYESGSGPGKSFADRYNNIRPWCHNRVKLDVPEGTSDYVNASPISVPASNEDAPTYKYVAMQGPTVSSFDSVWRMVAENTTSTAVIVQLTTMFEGEQPKCAQYFPFSDLDPTWELNTEDAWGDGWTATLTYESTEALCDGAIERRKFLLHVEGEEEPHIVWHLFYLRWPDFGVPALTDVQSFFELMKMSREHATEVDEPRFIHCSAGVGRTGTFICLEHLMRELAMGALDAVDPQDADADPVYETVDALRQQRKFMVQSQSQYLFIYQVMRKLWAEKYGLEEEDEMARSSGSIGQPALKRLEMAAEPAALEEMASNSSQISEGGASLDPN